MTETPKRPRGSPTGTTPQQAAKRGTSTRHRLEYTALEQRQPLANLQLTSNTSYYVPASAWSVEETKALVEFLLFNDPKKWPSTKDEKFWKSAATFVQERARGPRVRTGIHQVKSRYFRVIPISLS
jgi:hypothetical protein